MEIQLHDKVFTPFISQDVIAGEVKRLATALKKDLKDEVPLFIGILNGSFLFAADFIRNYKGDCEVSFVKFSSYEGTASTGEVKQLLGINEDLTGRTVVILEDIVDTGNTLEEIYQVFEDKGVKALKIVTLFYKPSVFKKDLKIDYIGFEIPNTFIVGYGLDYDGYGRNIPSIYQLKLPNQMKNIVLFGPPGAGKGTQAKLLKDKFNLVHISTGDVFRFNIKNDTALGRLAKTFMDKGDLVSDEVTIKMLKAEVAKYPDAKGFIFDGFPRTEDQAYALDLFLAEKGMTINAMIALEADEDTLVSRILERGKTSGRVDDQDESKIRNRFNEYETKTAPLNSYYANQGKYIGVNGIGDIAEITERLSAEIEKL